MRKIAFVIPFLIITVFFLALKRDVPIYSAFIEGAAEGMRTVLSVFPPLAAVLALSAMLRESGLISTFASFLEPLTSRLGIPPEILPLALIRPLSGSGSIGLLTDTVKTFGTASPISRSACILCAASETTFYTLSVYFGQTKVKYTKKVVLAALFGDLAGFFCACILGKINI